MKANDAVRKPTVSVHIVTYNSEDCIQSCLESVWRQTYPISQIIVIDNASSDRTVDILQKVEDRIRLVRNAVNTGFAAAHNQAIGLSSCDWFLILNPDVQLAPDHIERLIRHVDRVPYIGSIGGKLLRRSDSNTIDSAGIEMSRIRRAVDRGSGEPADQWHKPGETFGISGAAVLYARSMVEQIETDGQFFDESFFAYKEDVDVAWRARLLGWKAYYVPDAIGYHERGWKLETRHQQSLRIRRHSYINRYLMLIKNENVRHLLVHLPLYVAYDISVFLYLLFREPKVLAAWGSFFRLLKPTWNKRKIIQDRARRRWHENER